MKKENPEGFSFFVVQSFGEVGVRSEEVGVDR